MAILLAALTALMSSATPVVAGDFEDAEAANKAGDYKKEFRLLKGLAEQGDADAQFNLGIMYANGEGVPKDYAKAAYWFLKAAEQGIAEAQNNLGTMYQYGEGVPKDYVQAYVWMSIAATQGNANAQKGKGTLKKEMTREQIAKGQELSSEYWEKYVVPFQKN